MHTISSTVALLLSGAAGAAVLSLFATVGVALLIVAIAVLWMSIVYATLDRLSARRAPANDRRRPIARVRR